MEKKYTKKKIRKKKYNMILFILKFIIECINANLFILIKKQN